MNAESMAASGPMTQEKRVPLSDAQRELWFASQMSDGASLAYNESMTLRLKGPLNVAALRRALRLLVARHEALRTRIAAAGDAQRVSPAGDIELVTEELPASVPIAEREERAAAWIDERVHRQFNLVDGPLARAALLRLDPQTHLLTLIVHHVICDGWSLGVMARELGTLYGAELQGRAAKLAPAPSLTAYLEQQSTERNSPANQAAREFWQKEFADGAPVFELPSDHPRKVERTFRGALITRSMSPDLVEGLKRLCAEKGCTAFTALLATFSVLLHRLAGVEEVVVGVPSAGQVMAGFGAMVGHFANLLPVRSVAPADATFAEYLGRMREKLTNAMEHWRYPFSSLLQHLNLPRDASRVPLAPVVFNTTGKHVALEFGGLKAEAEPARKHFVNFDLNFHFGVQGDRVTLGCYYSTELFEAATVERWLTHFETVLRGAIANPDARLGQLSLLSEAEKRRILHEWNDTALEYRREATVAQLFEEQVQRSPHAVAVVAGRERLTYAELGQRADAVAAALRTHGVGPDVLAGVFVERTSHLPAAMLGVLKAGGAYVPMDLAHPMQRLEFIVRDTQMRAIVTQRSLAALLPKTDVPVIFVDELELGATSDRAHDARATSKDLAYVIYTSGSTGQPKGVCLENRGVSALIAWARRQYRAEELDGVLFATNATFDVSVFETLVPLCLGGKIIVAENILMLHALPAVNEVRLISGVPSAVAELVRANHIPASVMTVNVAGEPCPQSLVEALYQLPHIERVVDVYGPTETTVYSTGSVRRAGGRATIGRPLPNERTYILDRAMQPVPVGVRGELYIGGEKLARGYLNRPELTAERFIASPFVQGERLYRTGDGARFMPDGTIEFLGRLDHQVKIRGYRIELGEIENALAKHPAVREAVVVARNDSAGGSRLVGYVVSAPQEPCSAHDLREFLGQRLPEYMVPARFVVLQELPRTSSGKVNRRALPEPTEVEAQAERVAPRNTTEEVLADIWREVLGIGEVSVHDNFFEVGGHSLLAAQVIARVHDLLGVDLTMRDFFSNPTIAAFAAGIEQALIEQIQAEADPRQTHASPAPFVSAKE